MDKKIAGNKSNLTIRRAIADDLPGITEIYNEAILTTTATFDMEPKSGGEQGAWFREHGGKYPIMVAIVGEGEREEGGEDRTIMGWASLSQWSDRCAYSDTAELSLYVKEEYRGRGIGKALMKEIIEAGGEGGLHSVLARIAEGNEASVRLHESAGFENVGIMREVGRKFGRLLDVHLMQLIYR